MAAENGTNQLKTQQIYPVFRLYLSGIMMFGLALKEPSEYRTSPVFALYCTASVDKLSLS
jgi:hypothetical protein